MLVQPMLADPWGQVYIEAMKARAIVVSCNVGAVPELTRDGSEGVMVDTPSPEALAEAVLDVYARPQAELDAMTRAAQARVTTSIRGRLLATACWPPCAIASRWQPKAAP